MAVVVLDTQGSETKRTSSSLLIEEGRFVIAYVQAFLGV